ncbi:MAG: CopD family protein [Archangium sp.]|nr:CopD family protein [Archangium sp.]MDP3155075.1 CopD family protein [Archangium sp.]MDP3572073.1 CopD family protein [Archangium sp.]
MPSRIYPGCFTCPCIGIPALVTQIITGAWLALGLLPAASWFDTSSPIARAVMLKLGLLACTALLAVDARLRIIPRLTPERPGASRSTSFR